MNASTTTTFLAMKPPARSRKAVKVWEQKDQPVQVSKPKRTTKVATPVVPQPETRPIEDPPPAEVKAVIKQPNPQYTPPIQVGFAPFKVLVKEREPIALFLFFLSEESLSAIVAATNMYANSQITVSHRWADRWSDITVGELLCWIGILFYMAKGTVARRNDYWPSLSPWISYNR